MYLHKNKKTLKKETLYYNEIENIFFENIKMGKSAYKLLRIYTSFDLMMIKSFFISENIPYFVEFEHLMKIYPFVKCGNYNNSNIYILDEDYNDAIIVINNYLKNKKFNEYKVKNVLWNVFEYLLMNYVVTSPQKYLCIDVNYK
jgi:hypothetical protein